MRRRGLAVPAEQPPGPGVDEVEERPLVMIRRFRDLPPALLAKGSLESAGIEAFFADENMVRMDWLYSNLLGGVKLLVDEANVAEANSVLNEPIPHAFEVDGVGEYAQPHCPRLPVEELDKMAYATFFVGVPIPFHKKAGAATPADFNGRKIMNPLRKTRRPSRTPEANDVPFATVWSSGRLVIPQLEIGHRQLKITRLCNYPRP